MTNNVYLLIFIDEFIISNMINYNVYTCMIDTCTISSRYVSDIDLTIISTLGFKEALSCINKCIYEQYRHVFKC